MPNKLSQHLTRHLQHNNPQRITNTMLIHIYQPFENNTTQATTTTKSKYFPTLPNHPNTNQANSIKTSSTNIIKHQTQLIRQTKESSNTRTPTIHTRPAQPQNNTTQLNANRRQISQHPHQPQPHSSLQNRHHQLATRHRPNKHQSLPAQPQQISADSAGKHQEPPIIYPNYI